MTANFLTDFSDRISPMLVKELRQGMRARTFIVVFLSLQIFLAVMLLSAGLAGTSDQVGSMISGVIFTFFSITVVLIQPLRGTGALAVEIKGNTIDMMVLTRLSAWRIVFGKWVAIVSQSALLLTTIIPYLILRYFFGGMNLISEIAWLLILFFTSMGLTAVTVGLSGCRSVIVRSLLPVFGIPILLWSMLVMSFSMGMGGSRGFASALAFDSKEAYIGVAAYLASVAYLGYNMLSLGASLIAPAAENHSLPRRLAALILVMILLPLGLLNVIDEGILVTLMAVICVPAILLALTDSAMLVPTVCKKFVKAGWIGRIAGRFFYPCWSSGILFTLLISLLALLSICIVDFPDRGFGEIFDVDEWVVLLSLLGSMFFPSVWQVFLFRGEGQRLAHYLLLLVGSYVILGVLTALSGAMNNGVFLWFFAWNPLAYLPMLIQKTASEGVILGAVILLDLLLAFILLVKATTEIKRSAPVIEETKNTHQSAG